MPFPKKHGWLTVKDLKEKLADLPDDMIVVCNGSDHSYDPICNADMVNAEYVTKGQYFGQYYNDESMIKGAEKIRVILVDI